MIDLQMGITAMLTNPPSSAIIVENAIKLAETSRRKGAPVFLVHVTPPADGEDDDLHPATDSAMQFKLPASTVWVEIVPELGPEENDFVITNRQWVLPVERNLTFSSAAAA